MGPVGSIEAPSSTGYAARGGPSRLWGNVPPVAGTVRDAIRAGTERLARSPAIDHYPKTRDRWEATALVAHVLDVDEEDLDRSEPLDARARRRFDGLIRRRAGGEPMAHILGYMEFRDLRFRVRPGTFVPRQSSEFTVVQAARRLRGRRRPVMVDLATGIGPIATSVAHEVRRARVHGTDISPEAIRDARAHARELRVRNVTFHTGDLYRSLPKELRGKVDVITIHAPYVPREEVEDLPLEVRGFEPEHTLTDYSDLGMELLTRAAEEGREWLRSGGWLLAEVSPDRGRPARAVMRAAGYRDIRSTRGWPNVTRVLVGRR
jgi:release factor glutamine methyltransferase